MLKRFLIEVLVAIVTMFLWCAFVSFTYQWLPADNMAGPLILTSLVVFMVGGMVAHEAIVARWRPNSSRDW